MNTSRRRQALFWVLAAVITLSALIYQSLVGPTRSVRGRVTVGGSEITYELRRSHGGPTDHEVSLRVPADEWRGELVYRRYKTNDLWSRETMALAEGRLSALLPRQPPAGKLAYWVELSSRPDAVGEGNAAARIPPTGPAVIRFRGAVPAVIWAPHVILMFSAMLLSNRAAIEALRPRRQADGREGSAGGGGAAGEGGLRRYTYWALGLMALGGLAFGPAMQWYAFGEWWTGIPFGYDLTDNKTLIAVVAWVIAASAVRRRSATGRGWVLAAALVTLVIFSIPHSVIGTELDYAALPAAP